MNCKRCNDTGVYETGNNDEPCDCPAGDTAEFNVCKLGGGLRVVTGAELRREHATALAGTAQVNESKGEEP